MSSGQVKTMLQRSSHSGNGPSAFVGLVNGTDYRIHLDPVILVRERHAQEPIAVMPVPAKDHVADFPLAGK